MSLSDTISESFGLAPVEAMACGLPQIVTDWDGHRDTVVHGETGFLIPTYWMRCDADLIGSGDLLGWPYDHLAMGQSVVIDAKALRGAIQALIDSPGTRAAMSAASRRRAVAEFGAEAVTRKHEALWLELIAIAGGLRLAGRRLFDQPRYYDYFGHYASSPITGSERLFPGPQSGDIDRVVPATLASLPHVTLFDCSLLHAMISLVSTQCEGCCAIDGVELSSLFQVAGAENYPPSLVARHILWLLKHSYLRMG